MSRDHRQFFVYVRNSAAGAIIGLVLGNGVVWWRLGTLSGLGLVVSLLTGIACGMLYRAASRELSDDGRGT